MNRRRFFGVAATAPAAAIAKPAAAVVEMVEADIAPVLPLRFGRPSIYGAPNIFCASHEAVSLEDWANGYLKPQIKALAALIDESVAKDMAATTGLTS